VATNTVKPVEVQGLKEALRVLGKFDVTLRKQFTKDFKQAVSPVVEAAQANIPNKPPLSGMTRKWKGKPLWADNRNHERDIKLRLDTRRARNRNRSMGAQWETVGTIGVIAGGRALAIFDMAGRKGVVNLDTAGGRMIDAMNDRYRRASRSMWPAADESLNEVTRNCVPICNRAVAEANRLLEQNNKLGRRI